MIKCAIFDLDGTLVDSMPYWIITPKTYIKSLNKEVDYDLLFRFLSVSLPEGCQFIIDRYNLDKTVSQVSKELDEIMENYYLTKVKLKPNMLRLLEIYKKRGIKMALASSTDKELILKVIKHFGIDKYFSFVISSSEIGKGKSFPDIYLKCTNELEVKPEESIIFEDLPYGLISTKPYGFIRVGLYDEPSKDLQEKIKNASNYYFEEIGEKELMILESLLDK